MATTPTSTTADVRAGEGDGGAPAEQETAAARNLFDLRTIIGALFMIYGVYLTIRGIVDAQSAITQAAGVRINLWTGLAALLIGGLFLLWAFLRPLTIEEIVEGTADSIEHEVGREQLRGEREAATRRDR